MISPANLQEEAGINKVRAQTTSSKTQSLNYNDLTLEVFPDVYFPREDSFLLAGAAQKYAYGKVLDLGCGSGIVGISAAKSKKTSEIIFADLSRTALENAKSNAQTNNIHKPHSFIQTNLFSALKNEKFDTICFNPPYLPTSKSEKLKGEINRAFDGGKDGRKIIDKFLPQLENHLPQNGVLLFLQSSLANKEKTVKYLQAHRLSVTTISSQRFFFEEIEVLLSRNL